MAGPDGINSFFYQHFWGTSGKDVTEMIKDFFGTKRLEEGINKTSICLITKKLNANKLVGFRPMNLCNVTFKSSQKFWLKG